MSSMRDLQSELGIIMPTCFLQVVEQAKARIEATLCQMSPSSRKRDCFGTVACKHLDSCEVVCV